MSHSSIPQPNAADNSQPVYRPYSLAADYASDGFFAQAGAMTEPTIVEAGPSGWRPPNEDEHSNVPEAPDPVFEPADPNAPTATAAEPEPYTPNRRDGDGRDRTDALKVDFVHNERMLHFAMRSLEVFEFYKKELKTEDFNQSGESGYQYTWDSLQEFVEEHGQLPGMHELQYRVGLRCECDPSLPPETWQDTREFITKAWREIVLPVNINEARNYLRRFLYERRINSRVCGYVTNEGAGCRVDNVQSFTEQLNAAKDRIDEVCNSASANRMRFMTAAEYCAQEFPENWLIEGVCALGKLIVAAGPPKSLKTSCMADLAVSAAMEGGKWLNSAMLPVAKRMKVCMMSAETVERPLRSLLNRVATSKGTSLAELGEYLRIEDCVPRLLKDDLKPIYRKLKNLGTELLVLDPWYRIAPGSNTMKKGSQGSAADMSEFFVMIDDISRATGITTAIVAHSQKHVGRTSLKERRWLSLEDVSGAGISEHANSWLLMNARAEYEMDGQHKLWLNAACRGGVGKLVEVDINQGLDCEMWCAERVARKESRDEQQANKVAQVASLQNAVLSYITENAGEVGVRLSQLKSVRGIFVPVGTRAPAEKAIEEAVASLHRQTLIRMEMLGSTLRDDRSRGGTIAAHYFPAVVIRS